MKNSIIGILLEKCWQIYWLVGWNLTGSNYCVKCFCCWVYSKGFKISYLWTYQLDKCNFGKLSSVLKIIGNSNRKEIIVLSTKCLFWSECHVKTSSEKNQSCSLSWNYLTNVLQTDTYHLPVILVMNTSAEKPSQVAIPLFISTV